MEHQIFCTCGERAVWRRDEPSLAGYALGDNEYLCDSCWCDLAMTVPVSTRHYVRLVPALVSLGAPLASPPSDVRLRAA